MRLFLTSYTLRNGYNGHLCVIASSWFGALEVVWNTFSEVRRCSVRPA
jgi:hypothetical protein